MKFFQILKREKRKEKATKKKTENRKNKQTKMKEKE
jgi:hypothetical protein